MQTEIHNLIGRLQAVTDAINEMCRNLDSADLNWKPSPEAWSIAQILEHIIKVNASYYPILTALQKGTYHLSWTARIPFLPRLFGRMILNSVKPENLRKVRMFPLWNPEASTIDESIVDDFLLHQTELKNHIASSSDLLERHVVISSPANANIVYTLEDAFHIIVTHEERHLAQMNRILALQGTH